MKVRYGFVSNSSSSSFCIFGVGIYEINEKLFNETSKNKLKEDKITINNNNNWEILEYLFSKNSLIDFWITDVDSIYIGASLKKIEDDQTMGDFKVKVIEELKKVFNFDDNDIEISICEYAWMDG